MTFFPNFRTIIKIGSFSLGWYPVLLCTGAYLIYLFCQKGLRKEGYPQDIGDDLFIGCAIGGIVGARLWFCVFYDLSYYLNNPLEIFKTWNGGLAIQGAILGASIFLWFYAKKKRYSFMRICDQIFPYILIGQGLGRWGNFFNQECFGPETTAEALWFVPKFIVDKMFIQGSYRQPMFFYEFVFNMIGFVIIMFIYKKFSNPKRGDLTYAYLMWYGVERTFIEYFRTDSLMIGNLKMAQVTGIFCLVLGMIGMLGLFRKFEEKPTIIFDFDQTLALTEPIILLTFEELFKKYLPDHPFGDAEKKYVLGPTLKESFEYFNFPGNVDDLVSEYRAINKKLHTPEYLKEMPGATELLKSLKEQGYKIGVGSNKMTETVWFGAEICGFKEYIDAVIGMDKVVDVKPNPECIYKCLAELNGSRDSAIYVGDVYNDVKTGNNAGCFTIGFNQKEENLADLVSAGANRTTTNLLDILEIVKEDDHSWTSNMI